MDFRARRLEQRRQQRLGRFILATAVAVAIVLASIIMAFLPPVPIVATIAFYALAVVIAGAIDRALRRALGYQARKASLQHLRSDSSEGPLYPASTQSDPSPDAISPADAQIEFAQQNPDRAPDSLESHNQSTGSSQAVRTCPNCKTRVVPKADGKCPACQNEFPQ